MRRIPQIGPVRTRRTALAERALTRRGAHCSAHGNGANRVAAAFSVLRGRARAPRVPAALWHRGLVRVSTRRRNAGFTLLEVMIGFALATLLFIGMNQFWVVVASQIDLLTIRQKAVFRINGEMERLTEYYRIGAGVGTSINSTNYNAVPDGWVPGSLITSTAYEDRIVYGAAIADVVVDDTNVADFQATIDARTPPKDVHEVYSLIYLFDPGVAPNNERNVVWLDRELNVVGRLSWHLEPIAGTDSAGVTPCHQGTLLTACYLLTIFLDFPLRYVDEDAPLAGIPAVPVDTITLQTIIGARDET